MLEIQYSGDKMDALEWIAKEVRIKSHSKIDRQRDRIDIMDRIDRTDGIEREIG